MATITRTKLKKLILKRLEIIGGTETASSDLDEDVEVFLDWFVEESHVRSTYLFTDPENTFPSVTVPYVMAIVSHKVAGVTWSDVDPVQLEVEARSSWGMLAGLTPIESSSPVIGDEY